MGNTNKAFTDKELQIAAELAYMSFTDDMVGKTLNELFAINEAIGEKIAYKEALRSLYRLVDEGKWNYERLIEYKEASLELITDQLVEYGFNYSMAKSYAETVCDDCFFRLSDEWSEDGDDALLDELDKILKTGISDENYRNQLCIYNPVGFKAADSNELVEHLISEFMHTRKLYPDSEGVNRSRYNAAMELFHNLMDPDNPSKVGAGNDSVDWEDISNWSIVDVRDINASKGFYAVTINANGKLIVAFRGSESFDTLSTENDWILADAFLLNNPMTEQQTYVEEYMNYLHSRDDLKDYEWYTVGHSLGGNLAEHAVLWLTGI